MIESFLSVGTQVLILFLMIGTGFVLGKLHLITHKGAVSMSNLLMYVVSPCILIVVFQRPLEHHDEDTGGHHIHQQIGHGHRTLVGDEVQLPQHEARADHEEQDQHLCAYREK